MYKAKLIIFGKEQEHRVWTVTSAEDNVSKTVVFSYGSVQQVNGKAEFTREQTRERVCFFIDHVAGHAIIIDNGEWDLLAFDLEYSRADVRQACDHFLQFIYNNHKVVESHDFEFGDYDELMQEIS